VSVSESQEEEARRGRDNGETVERSFTNSTPSLHNMSGSSGRSRGKGIVLILSSCVADQRGSRTDLSFPFATFKSAPTDREFAGSGRTTSLICSGTML